MERETLGIYVIIVTVIGKYPGIFSGKEKVNMINNIELKAKDSENAAPIYVTELGIDFPHERHKADDNTDADRTTSFSNTRLALIELGSFMFYFCSWGMVQSFGVMYIELLERFGGSKTQTSWVQSLNVGTQLCAAPFACKLLNRFGCRTAGVIGSLTTTAGFVLSAFSPSLQVLYVTYGIIAGFGESLLLTTAPVVVFESFKRHTTLMYGIGYSGASVGTFVIPVLTQKCLDEYGFSGTFLLLGGICLNCLVVSLVFVTRPRGKTATSMGIGELVGKFSFGFLGDVKCLDTTLLHIVPAVMFGTLTVCCNFVTKYVVYCIVAGSIGLTSAIFNLVHVTIPLQLLGPEDLSTGLGLSYFGMGIGNALGGTIAGVIADASGRYDETFYYCGAISVVAAVIAAYILTWKRIQ